MTDIPEEMLDLVRFLAGTWASNEDCIYKAYGLGIDEVRDLMMKEHSVVQGSKNQRDLKTIGKQKCDTKNIRKAVDWILENYTESS